MADQLFFCEIVSPVQWLARRFTNALIFKTNSTYGTIPPLLNRLAPLDQDGVVSGPSIVVFLVALRIVVLA